MNVPTHNKRTKSIRNAIPASRNLSILQWNIQSANSGGGPKTDDEDFVKIISLSSIFCLQETKTEFSLPGYWCFNKLRSGSKSGGLCIGIERELCSKWKVTEIQNDCEDILAVNIWTRDSEDPFLVVSVYDSPENSTYKRNRRGGKGSTLDSVLDLLLTNPSSKILLTGDFNARTANLNHDLVDNYTDTSSAKSSVHTYGRRVSQDRAPANARGNSLLELLAETNVTLLNGNCLGDVSGAVTCIKYNGASVVDYTAVSSSLLNQVTSFRVLDLNPFSDHRPSITTLKIDAPRLTCSDLMDQLLDVPPRFKTSKEGAMEAFAAQINCPEVNEMATDITRTECFTKEAAIDLNEDLIKIFLKSAESAIPSKRKSYHGKRTRFIPKQPWYDKECAKAKRLVDKLSKRTSSSPCSSNRENLYAAKSAYRRLVKNKKKEFINGLSSEIHSGTLNWSKLRKLKNIHSGASKLDAFDMRNFCIFFRNLYSSKGRPPGLAESLNVGRQQEDDLRSELDHILNAPVTSIEVRGEVKRLKSGKAVSTDQIANEFIKACGDHMISALTHLFNQCLSNQVYPWKESVVTPLHKKGSSYDPNNYRAIAVSSNIGKLFSSILLNRLIEFRSTEFPDPLNQLGFTKGAETADHILTLKTAVDKHLKLKKGREARLYTAFVDYSKAFDTVCREALLYKLWKYGVGGNFFGVLQDMYTSSSARVKLLGKLSERIEVLIGTEQGHPMSPELFKIYLYELSQQLDSTPGVNAPCLAGKFITHLLWADDLVLMASDHESLQSLLNSLQHFCTEWGLTVNIEKTAIMVFNTSSKVLNESQTFTYGNTRIPSAKTYCYLGVVFTLNGSFKFNTNHLRQKAIRSVMSLRRAVNFSVLPPDTLLKLFDLLIVPIVTYCHQVWLPLTSWARLNRAEVPDLKALASDPLEKLHLSFLKIALGVNRKTSNCVMWGDTGRLPLAFSLKKSVVRYFSRVCQLSADYPTESSGLTPLLVHAFRDQQDLGLDWYQNITKFLREHNDDTFIDSWEASRQSNRKLGLYNEIKFTFEREPYLAIDRKFARSVAKIRSASHPLNIERGRYSYHQTDNFSIERARLCPSCTSCSTGIVEGLFELPLFDSIKEDEPHFLLECPLYEDLRERFIPDSEPRLPMVRLRNLFREGTTDSDPLRPIKQTSLFIEKALERRHQFEKSRVASTTTRNCKSTDSN